MQPHLPCQPSLFLDDARLWSVFSMEISWVQFASLQSAPSLQGRVRQECARRFFALLFAQNVATFFSRDLTAQPPRAAPQRSTIPRTRHVRKRFLSSKFHISMAARRDIPSALRVDCMVHSIGAGNQRSELSLRTAPGRLLPFDLRNQRWPRPDYSCLWGSSRPKHRPLRLACGVFRHSLILLPNAIRAHLGVNTAPRQISTGPATLNLILSASTASTPAKSQHLTMINRPERPPDTRSARRPRSPSQE